MLAPRSSCIWPSASIPQPVAAPYNAFANAAASTLSPPAAAACTASSSSDGGCA